MSTGLIGGRDSSTLTLRPKAFWSWDFDILDGDRVVAVLDRHWLREMAAFDVEGQRWQVRRTSVMRGTFALELDGRVVAEAQKTSSFRRAFAVTVGPERFELRAVSIFRREFQLFRGGIAIGSIRPTSPFRRHAIAQLPSSLPLPLRLFLVFLVLVIWKRQSDSAATGGGS